MIWSKSTQVEILKTAKFGPPIYQFDKILQKRWRLTLKGLNLCFNIMNVKLCLLNQELENNGLVSIRGAEPYVLISWFLISKYKML